MVDPAPRSSGVNSIIAVACWGIILAVVALELLGHARSGKQARASRSDDGGPGIQLVVTGRGAVAMAHNPAASDAVRTQLLDALRRAAQRPVDRLATATVVREVSGAKAAAEYLTHNRPDADDRLASDADALASLYESDSADRLTEDQRADLIRDLGFFGRLAASQGGDEQSPARQAVLAEAQRISTVLSLAGLGVIALLFGGLAAFVTVIVLFATRVFHFRYEPTAPIAPPIWLETFAVWLVAFVVMGIVAARVRLHTPIVVGEAMAAVLTAVVAVGWPALRARMTFGEIRQALGWHAGRGVFKEIGCGMLGYLAGLPVVGVALAITLLLMKTTHTASSHPIEQQFGQGTSPGHTLGLFLTAAVLAPLLEETLFRGALYGHLRRRHRAWISAGVVAFVFAAIHPQGWVAIPALGSIALILAFLREWRGSLIAPVVAHGINNGVLVGLLLLLTR